VGEKHVLFNTDATKLGVYTGEHTRIKTDLDKPEKLVRKTPPQLTNFKRCKYLCSPDGATSHDQPLYTLMPFCTEVNPDKSGDS